MTVHIALLRAVNVGGTGKLPMRDLRAMCDRIGFTDVRTVLAIGNVVFESDMTGPRVKAALEASLEAYAGKHVDVMVRTGPEMAAVLAANPFPGAPPNWTVAIFLDDPPPAAALDDVRGRDDEDIVLGKREIYVRYGKGMGRSKLRIPAAETGTARNMNTVARLANLAAGR